MKNLNPEKLYKIAKWALISSIVFFVVLNYKLVISFLAAFFLYLYFKIC
jgi:hypothetical protein